MNNLNNFYSHVPKDLLDKVVKNTEKFEIIGKFELPLLLSDSEVSVFDVLHITSFETGHKYYVVYKGELEGMKNPLFRIESVCNYAHLFNSQRCDCRWQMMNFLKSVSDAGEGLLVFCLDQHGKAIPEGTRGHALIYALGQLQNQELIVDAYLKNGFKEDYRDYSDVIDILKYFKIEEVRLFSNNPSRISDVEKGGIKVNKIKHEENMNEWVCEELIFKKNKLNHNLGCLGFKKEFLDKYNLKL